MLHGSISSAWASGTMFDFYDNVDGSANDIDSNPGISKRSRHSVLVQRDQNKRRNKDDKKSNARYSNSWANVDCIRLPALSRHVRCTYTNTQQDVWQNVRSRLENLTTIRRPLIYPSFSLTHSTWVLQSTR